MHLIIGLLLSLSRNSSKNNLDNTNYLPVVPANTSIFDEKLRGNYRNILMAEQFSFRWWCPRGSNLQLPFRLLCFFGMFPTWVFRFSAAELLFDVGFRFLPFWRLNFEPFWCSNAQTIGFLQLSWSSMVESSSTLLVWLKVLSGLQKARIFRTSSSFSSSSSSKKVESLGIFLK